MIIVGSQALIRAIGPVRKPSDVDIFGTVPQAENFLVNILGDELRKKQDKGNGKVVLFGYKGSIVEVDTLTFGCNYDLYHAMMLDHDKHQGIPHANIHWQLFLKLSHRYKKDSPHFLKTMQDIHLLRLAGANLPEGYELLFKSREAETYTYLHPNLNQGKDTFFDASESFYKYDHDSIHRAVAVKGVPAYTLYMQDGAQVQTSKEKFFALPEETRLNGVLEESYVLALERSLIPYDFKPNPKQAFDMALSKVCTSITSGWFREFAWENYFKVQSMYNANFVDKFQANLDRGWILDFERK